MTQFGSSTVLTQSTLSTTPLTMWLFQSIELWVQESHCSFLAQSLNLAPGNSLFIQWHWPLITFGLARCLWLQEKTASITSMPFSKTMELNSLHGKLVLIELQIWLSCRTTESINTIITVICLMIYTKFNSIYWNWK